MIRSEDAFIDQKPDIKAGKFMRGKKKDKTPAKYFNFYIFELDPKTMQPKQIGEHKGKDNKLYPKYRIIRSFRIAESSLRKVLEGKQNSCNVYLKLSKNS